MPVKLKNDWRDTAIFISAILVIVSLFVSRAALSISAGVFVLLMFLRQPLGALMANFFRNPFLAVISLLFWGALLSGFWSADLEEWQRVVQVKFPLLLLPIALASSFHFTKMQWRALAALVVGIVLMGAFWSAGYYVRDPEEVTAGYSRAKTMLTPLGNDRIRFSWLTAFAIGLSFFNATKFYREKNQWMCVAFAVGGLLLVIYLHLLAVRTGLLCFYLALFVAGFQWMFAKKQIGFIAILLVVVLPLAAYLTLPGFKKRMDYLRYQMDFALNGSYIPGSTDPVRFISLRAGTEMMRNAPLAGIGFGDIHDRAKNWYRQHYPQMHERDQILPSSEYILHGAAAGIPGLLVFMFCMLYPFFLRVRAPFAWSLLNLGIAAGFLFDIGLEVQYGVFIYLLTLLLCWKWQVDENS